MIMKTLKVKSYGLLFLESCHLIFGIRKPRKMLVLKIFAPV